MIYNFWRFLLALYIIYHSVRFFCLQINTGNPKTYKYQPPNFNVTLKAPNLQQELSQQDITDLNNQKTNYYNDITVKEQEIIDNNKKINDTNIKLNTKQTKTKTKQRYINLITQLEQANDNIIKAKIPSIKLEIDKIDAILRTNDSTIIFNKGEEDRVKN